MSILNGNNNKIIRSNVIENLNVVDVTGSSGYYTSVVIKDSKTGRILHSSHNTTVLGGRIAQLEELFGISKNSEQHLLLNDMLGINHSETQNVLNSQTIKRKCNYFMVGNGAASKSVVGKYYSPKNYETKLYNPIPFRMVPLASDLSSTEQAKYAFRKVEEVNGVQYASYFAKKFNPGNVILEYNASTYKPTESHTTPVDENDSTHPLRGGSVLAYISFTIDIAEEEMKEYFRIHDGNINNCAMSEIGLVYGAALPNTNDSNRSELAAAELLSKLTSPSVGLSEDGSSRQIQYKIYAR